MPGRCRTRDPAAKRRAILDAAGRLFAGRRYHEVTTDDIAREAGVSKGTIYNHFADKDELCRQLVTDGVADCCAELDQLAASDTTGRERVVEACRLITAFETRRRSMMGLAGAEEARIEGAGRSVRGAWRASRGSMVAALARCLAEPVEAGVFAADYPVDALARLLFGLLRSNCRGPRLTPESIAGLFLDGAAKR